MSKRQGQDQRNEVDKLHKNGDFEEDSLNGDLLSKNLKQVLQSQQCTAESTQNDNFQNIFGNQTKSQTVYMGGQYTQCSFNSGTGPVTNEYNNNMNSCPDQTQTMQDKVKHLKETLTKYANEESGKMTSPIRLQLATSIDPVPLQMTSNRHRSLAHLDDEGHYNRRKDFEIMLSSRKGDVSLEQLFERAKQEAKAQAATQTNNEEARTKYVQQHGNTVTLLGQAGIGKTTLARIMMKLILKGELFPVDPTNQYVFFIQIRKLNFEEELTFMQFALIGCSGQWQHDPESDKHFFEKLCTDANIVFIFDGLDEANCNQLNLIVSGILPVTTKSDIFLRKVLSGELFPQSKKVVTSRPRQFFELHPQNRPGYVVDILGLDEEGRDQLCKQICGEKYEQVKQYLLENPDISASCYVPVKCIIIVVVLSKCINESGVIDIRSLTDIFIQALAYYVRSPHVVEHAGEVWKLANLAWHGFSDRQIIFDEWDFKSAGITDKAFGAFLETFVDDTIAFQYNILDGDKKSSFSHLVWQELFAAVNLMILMPVNEFKENVKNINESSWEVVAVFMFGLCHGAVMKRIKATLSKQDEGWKKKKRMLMNVLLDGIPSVGSDSSKLLQLCSWIHEANSDDLNKEVLAHLPDSIVMSHVTILPTDASNITYVLQKVQRSFRLRIAGQVKFVQDSFKRFCKGLSLLSVKIKKFDLTNERISDPDAVAGCLHNVEELVLYDCGITNDGLKLIADKLKTLSHPIKVLNLSQNDIGDNGAIVLADSLCNIEELHIASCGITNVGVQAIANKLATFDQPIKMLYLNGNKIGDDGAIALVVCLHNIDMLHVWSCKITNIGLKALANKLATLSRTMKSLELRNNKIGDEGAIALAQCLHNIEEFNVWKCGITRCGAEAIAQVLETSNTPMTMLNINENMIGDDGAVALAGCLQNTLIQDLYFFRCGITSIGANGISHKLVAHDRMTRELVLGDNSISDDGAIALAQCLHKIEVLSLWNCAITHVGVKAIANKLATVNHRLKKLDLDCNSIGDDGAIAFAGCLHNIEKLILTDCGITNIGIKSIAIELATLDQPMKKLDLSDNRFGDDGAIALAACLHNITKLLAITCGISNVGAEAMAEKLSTVERPITVLSLQSNNFIGDEGAIAFARCLHNIKELNLKQSGLTKTGAEAILNKLTALPNPKSIVHGLDRLQHPY